MWFVLRLKESVFVSKECLCIVQKLNLFICFFVFLKDNPVVLVRFCKGISYNIRNIKFIPNCFPSIPPPSNFPFLLDSCTRVKPSLGLLLVAAVGSSTRWKSCLNIMWRRILKTV